MSEINKNNMNVNENIEEKDEENIDELIADIKNDLSVNDFFSSKKNSSSSSNNEFMDDLADAHLGKNTQTLVGYFCGNRKESMFDDKKQLKNISLFRDWKKYGQVFFIKNENEKMIEYGKYVFICSLTTKNFLSQDEVTLTSNKVTKLLTKIHEKTEYTGKYAKMSKPFYEKMLNIESNRYLKGARNDTDVIDKIANVYDPVTVYHCLRGDLNYTHIRHINSDGLNTVIMFYPKDVSLDTIAKSERSEKNYVIEHDLPVRGRMGF